MTDAKVTISRETLQAAIDALECALSDSRPYIVKSREVSTTLRAALAAQPIEHWSDCAVHNAPAYPPGPCDCGAQPVETVAWQVAYDAFSETLGKNESIAAAWQRVVDRVLAAAPPAPAAVPLTVSEIERMWSDAIMNGADGAILFARAIERAHGIAAAGDKP